MIKPNSTHCVTVIGNAISEAMLADLVSNQIVWYGDDIRLIEASNLTRVFKIKVRSLKGKIKVKIKTHLNKPYYEIDFTKLSDTNAKNDYDKLKLLTHAFWYYPTLILNSSKSQDPKYFKDEETGISNITECRNPVIETQIRLPKKK